MLSFDGGTPRRVRGKLRLTLCDNLSATNGHSSSASLNITCRELCTVSIFADISVASVGSIRMELITSWVAHVRTTHRIVISSVTPAMFFPQPCGTRRSCTLSRQQRRRTRRSWSRDRCSTNETTWSGDRAIDETAGAPNPPPAPTKPMRTKRAHHDKNRLPSAAQP